MKSNTTYHPPVIPVEDLGDGSYYYNFDIIETLIVDEDSGDTHPSYDYNQIRLKFPIDIDEIQEHVNTINPSHKVDVTFT